MTEENQTIPMDEPEAPPAEAPEEAALPEELHGYVDDDDPDVDQNWSIKDLAAADWALKRIGDLQDEMAENEEILADQVARQRHKTDQLNQKIARSVTFFEWHLRRFAESSKGVLLKGGKKKSRKLLHGTIGWRLKGGGWVVEDAEQLLAWAQQQPMEKGFVRITEAPALAAIKAHADATGEVPPGMDAHEPVDEFEVKALRIPKPKKEEESHADE